MYGIFQVGLDIRINISCWQFNWEIHRTAYVQVHTAFIHTSHRKRRPKLSPTTNTDAHDLDYTVCDQSQASDWVLVLNSTGLWEYAAGVCVSRQSTGRIAIWSLHLNHLIQHNTKIVC